jgi:hypothetical protein
VGGAPVGAARSARIDEYTAQVREALAEQSQREASREAYLRQEREAEAQGLETKAWQSGTGGPPAPKEPVNWPARSLIRDLRPHAGLGPSGS